MPTKSTILGTIFLSAFTRLHDYSSESSSPFMKEGQEKSLRPKPPNLTMTNLVACLTSSCKLVDLEVRTALHLGLGKQPPTPSESTEVISPFLVVKKRTRKRQQLTLLYS